MQLLGFALAVTVLLVVLLALLLLLGWPGFLLALAIGLAVLVMGDGLGRVTGRRRTQTDE